MSESPQQESWLNRTILGVGLTSLLSDWSHEAATAILPAFLSVIGVGPAWLGAIEGIADGLSSFTKLLAGHYTDRWKKRKPIAVFGYTITALATGSFAFVTHAYQLVIGRSLAWLGRGVRSPAKKALLTADTPSWAYGRAFGLERLMDTVGAIGGPVTALWLLEKTGHDFRKVFLWTLVPGLIAALCFLLLVRERPIERRAKKSLLIGLRELPHEFREFLLGVGVFGAGDFSHSLLILYATRMLTPEHGALRAASLAIALYTLHNCFSAASSYVSGWLSDYLPQRKYVLAGSYGLAVVTAILLCTGTHSLLPLGAIFLLAGIFEGAKEALEDAVAASCAPKEQHGMAFGTLAAVNAVGDFASSLLVGALWSAFNVETAFGVSAALFFSGAILILRLR
ncbi:MAG: MFS transporter [Acidobacteria bacterium]|nr:MFS transporter [Acidobacteriota bacterium]MBS1866055.1 MFS transporter [Acidobacteriota bacterium]